METSGVYPRSEGIACATNPSMDEKLRNITMLTANDSVMSTRFFFDAAA